MSTLEIDLLVIGAGPFGLAVAAQASHLGIEHRVVGTPMEFWRKNMPAGMFLRSACDWHLDPINVHTIDKFLAERGQTVNDIEPLSLDFYLSYAEWFQKQKQITAMPWHIQRLDTANGHFIATTTDGDTIDARNVVITSMPATQDFGPFFAFTISVRVSARLICEAVGQDLQDVSGITG